MRLARIPSLPIMTVLAGALWISPAPAAPPAPRAAPPKASSPQARKAAPQIDLAAQSVAVEIRVQASGKLKRFYASRNYWPLWAASGRIGPEADALLAFLASADLDGLRPSSYRPDELRETLAAARAGNPAALARAELRLSSAFARYVVDLRRRPKVGMTYADPRLKPRKPKPETVLRAAALPPSFGDYVAGMGWMNPHYLRIRSLLARAREQGAANEVLERLRLNLERTRALPGPWTHHIVVDAASGQLWYYQAGRQAGTMRVVVGAAKTQTPMLAGTLQYAILNPYWNVPTYLARDSIARKILSGRTLASMNMEVLSDWSATPARLDPATVDWNAVASGAREIRLRQLPGTANSMGKVKFLFPNDDGIFLHDTPDTDLFAKPSRHFSNGCIRLEDAARLGRWLLGGPVRTTSRQPEQPVALPVPVPVYLTYLTATENRRGVEFLEDVYGRDRLNGRK